jgi:glutathione S-transferase
VAGPADAHDTPVLVTIRFSHFCEKARWALSRAGVPFREDFHAPLFHVRPVRRAGGQRTTPVLRMGDRTLADSTDILHFADERGARLFPSAAVDPTARAEVDRLENLFDERLGPAVRRWVYFHLFQLPAPFVVDLFRSAAPPGEQAWVRPLFPLVRFGMKKGLKIDAAGAERSRRALDEVLTQVEARLATGARYLVGDAFTAADLTFAALYAPLVGPPAYGAPLPGFATLPEPFASLRDAAIAGPAGQFALRLYRDHRAERLSPTA